MYSPRLSLVRSKLSSKKTSTKLPVQGEKGLQRFIDGQSDCSSRLRWRVIVAGRDKIGRGGRLKVVLIFIGQSLLDHCL